MTRPPHLMRFIASLIFCLLALQSAALAADSDDAMIDQVMQKLESSLKSGDMTYAIEVLYAPVLGSMGGREAALAAAKRVGEQMKEQNIKMLQWKAAKPYQYVSAGPRQFSVIPYEAVMEVGGRKLLQTSYQLGIKDPGSPWQFVNGDNLNPKLFQKFFPDFPSTVILPKVERKFQE